MGIVLCKRCDGSGYVCPKCNGAWGRYGSQVDSVTRQLRNKHRRRATRWGTGCGVKAGKALPCPEHTATFFECDFGGERAPPVREVFGSFEMPEGWSFQNVPGTTKTGHCCSACQRALRVGMDFGLGKKADAEDLLDAQGSVACAFAFQLGQVTSSLRWLGRELEPTYLPTRDGGYLVPPSVQQDLERVLGVEPPF